MGLSFISPKHLKDRGILEIFADNEIYAIVQFRAVDSNNVPLPDGTVANIDDENDGRNLAATDDDTPGTGRIVYLSDGIGAFKLLPSATAKSFTLTISIEGYTDLTGRIDYNDPTVTVYLLSSNEADDPQWIDGIQTGYAKVLVASDYIDIDGIEFDVYNRPVVLTYTDESFVSHTVNTTTNTSGIVQLDFGPLTDEFTYVVDVSVSFSFVAGNRTIVVDEEGDIEVVFSREPIVSLVIRPTGDYNTPFKLWSDGRDEVESKHDFNISILYDYNTTYFSSAQFDIDNPLGVSVVYTVYDDEETLSIVSPATDTFDSHHTVLTATVGPSTKTTEASFEAEISDDFVVTFGNKTITYTDAVVDNFIISFVEPTFTLELEFTVGSDPDSPITLDDSLFPDGSKKGEEGKIDLGDVRAFSDDDLQFTAKAIISSDYNDIVPDSTTLVNKNMKFESYRSIIDSFNALVEDFDPNNDSSAFLTFDLSAELLDSMSNKQNTVYSDTTYDAVKSEVSTFILTASQEAAGDKNIYIKVLASTNFNYTFGSRILTVDDVSSVGILSFFPAAPRLSLDIQYHSEDPDDEENKLQPDQSKYLFSLVREGAVDSEGKAIQPTAQPEPRRRPGKFSVSMTDYLGESLPAETNVIVRTNDAFNPLILNEVTSYVEKVCRFIFDNPLEMKDSLYITVETTHNGLSRSVTEQVPYFTATDKEFYTKDLFMRNIVSLTNGFTTETSVVDDAMNELGYPFGQTPLYGAVFDAAIQYLDKLRDETFDNKFMVLLSDGVDNFSKESRQDSIDKVNSVEGKDETRIYPIALGNTSHISKMIMEDYAADTGSYTDSLLELRLGTEVEEIVNTILNHNYKNISSTTRSLSRDFKEIIRMQQMEIDIVIPTGFDVYIQARANSISNSINSSDWSTWTDRQQLVSGVNIVVLDNYLVGQYFEFRVTVIPSDLEV